MSSLINKKLSAQSLADIIRSEMKRKVLRPGDKLEPVRALCTRFQVGRGIVFPALKQLQKEGLLESHGRNGLFVTEAADSAYIKPAARIGFWYHFENVHGNAYNDLNSLSIAGMIRGCDIVFGFPERGVSLDKWTAGLDAVLVSGKVDNNLVRQFKELKVPFIVFGNYAFDESCNRLEVNEPEEIAMAVENIYSRLHFRSFGIVLHSPELYSAQLILKAIKQKKNQLGFQLRTEDIIFDSTENGYFIMEQIMNRPKDKRPDLISLSHQSIFGAARYIYEHSIKLPDRPLILCRTTESTRQFLPDLPDIGLHAGSDARFANDMLDWVLQLSEHPDTPFETRKFILNRTIQFSASMQKLMETEKRSLTQTSKSITD